VDVLYNLTLIRLLDVGGTFILKFDQFSHAFGFGVTTLAVYHLLNPYLNKKMHKRIIFLIIILISMGLGALNEIIEFIAKINFTKVNVGGYYNTILDIIFNAIGSTIAVIFIYIREKSTKKPLV
jgi:glycopeptide antibiotics resistance protein